jgi:hypothetical protein
MAKWEYELNSPSPAGNGLTRRWTGHTPTREEANTCHLMEGVTTCYKWNPTTRGGGDALIACNKKRYSAIFELKGAGNRGTCIALGHL